MGIAMASEAVQPCLSKTPASLRRGAWPSAVPGFHHQALPEPTELEAPQGHDVKLLTLMMEGTDLAGPTPGNPSSVLLPVFDLHAQVDVRLHVDGLAAAAADRRADLEGTAGTVKKEEQGHGWQRQSAPIAWEVKLALQMWPTAHIEQKATRS